MRMPHVCGDEPEEEVRLIEKNSMPHVCGDEPILM